MVDYSDMPIRFLTCIRQFVNFGNPYSFVWNFMQYYINHGFTQCFDRNSGVAEMECLLQFKILNNNNKINVFFSWGIAARAKCKVYLQE